MDGTPKKNILSQYKGPILAVLLVAAVGIVFCLFLLRLDEAGAAVAKLGEVLRPLFLGIIFAYLLYPLASRIQRRLMPLARKLAKAEGKALRHARAAAALIALVIVLAVIVFLGWLCLPQLGATVMSLMNDLPQQMASLQEALASFGQKYGEVGAAVESLINRVLAWIQNWVGNLLDKNWDELLLGLASGVSSAVIVVKDVIIGIILAVYLLCDRRRLLNQGRKLVCALFPQGGVRAISNTVRECHRIVSGFIMGTVVDCLIVGLLCFGGMMLLDLPYAALISLIVGVFNCIPFFGPYIGGIPSAFLILLADPTQGLVFIIFIVILQVVEGNIIAPQVLSTTTGLSPFWVLVATLLFGGGFGFIGMLVGVPVFAVIYYIIGAVIHYVYRRKTGGGDLDEGRYPLAPSEIPKQGRGEEPPEPEAE